MEGSQGSHFQEPSYSLLPLLNWRVGRDVRNPSLRLRCWAVIASHAGGLQGTQLTSDDTITRIMADPICCRALHARGRLLPLVKALGSCPVELDLRNTITSDELGRVIAPLGRLRTLAFGDSRLTTSPFNPGPAALQAIAKCKALCRLSLSGKAVPKQGLDQIALLCTNLTAIKLDFEGGPLPLRQLNSAATRLRELELDGLWDRGSLRSFLWKCSRLERVALTGPIEALELLALAKKSASLKSLHLDAVELGTASPARSKASSQRDRKLVWLLSKALSLTSLSLGGFTLHGGAFPEISALSSALTSLTSLQIENCKGLSSQAIAQGINSWRGLHSLSLSSASIRDAALPLTAERYGSLRSLTLASGEVTDKTAFRLAKCCRVLRVLNLHGTSITDKGIEQIAQSCTRLSSLALSSAKITDRSLFSLTIRGRRWKRLELLSCPLISAEGLKQAIAKWPALTQLKLVDVAVSNGVLEALAEQCGQLKLFQVSEEFPNCFDDGCERGVIALARGCTRLEVLDLSWRVMTTNAVQAIAHNLSRLRELKLNYRSAQSAIEDRLRRHLPYLQVLNLSPSRTRQL